MRISAGSLKALCRKRGLKLKDLLTQACVSRTAYYSLLRKESVLPRSLLSIAKALGTRPSAFLEEESPEEKKMKRLQKKLARILESNPGLDRENIWHTLRLLELPPIERLRRGLLRAQKFDFHR